MKKGLSVLLIAAALFGFYGGAVSINDVLACKDYWEKEGEKSTADMNKLEDGLNQLKDNEQAYLDGLETLAEGEKTLADGEATLADGEAQYAQGLADYKAAPAKLRAAEAAIADGEDKLDDLATLLDGVKQIHEGYVTMSAYEKMRDGRDDTLAHPDTATLALLQEKLGNLQDGIGSTTRNSSVPALQTIGTNLYSANQESRNQEPYNHSDSQYAGFYKYLGYNCTALNTAYDLLDEDKDAIDSYIRKINSINSSAPSGLGEDYASGGSVGAPVREIFYGMTTNDLQPQLDLLAAGPTAVPNDQAEAVAKNLAQDDGKTWDDLTPTEKETYMAKAKGGIFLGTANTIKTYLSGVLAGQGGVPGLSAVLTKLKGTIDSAQQWRGGYETLTSSDTIASKKKAVGGVAQIINGVYGSKNKTLIKGFENGAKAAGINLKKFTPAATSQLAKDMNSKSSIDDFYNDLQKIDKAFQKAKATAQKLKSDGEKELAAGKKLYAQGRADYAAAPGKLADAEKQLADGRQQLADGRQQLADGKKKLAEYEDGEQQVRDGLATLMGTEADLDLESILDRRNGDDNFDDPNGHLQLDEGLDAVKTGREYQADDGVLITKEITARAIGTVGCLAAAALAILAGVLSLLKKYKAAAVSGILTAIAGAVGIAQGMSAGEYFSSIAGSTVGNTPFIAAGVLAAVAAVFAIVNFTAKKEEA